ncbi:MAG: hypothetical protein RL748_1894, partial [Pseudomonadota bacterium]
HAVLAQLQYAASSEQQHALWLNQQIAVLSDEKTAYFDVPAGEHTLHLESSGPFLARLLQREGEPYQPGSDYRFAKLNAGLDFARIQPGPGAATNSAPAASPWALPQPAISQAAHHLRTEGATGAAAALQVANRLQQDNRYREGASGAAALLQQAASQRPDDQALRQEAREFAARLVWQDLLPLDNPARASAEPPASAAAGAVAGAAANPPPARLAWYTRPRLRAIDAAPWGQVYATQQQDGLLAGLHSGRFFALDSSPQHYLLPPRSNASSLHLALEGAQPGERIWLQLDQQAPLEFKVGAPVAAKLLHSDPALLGLQMQQWRYGESGGTTLDAAFSRQHLPAQLVAASSIELPLPAHIGRVKLWRELPGPADTATSSADATSNAPWVALKLRMAQPFALSETALLGLLEQQPPEGAASLLRAMGKVPDSSAPQQHQAQLASQLQPLLRFIGSEFNLLSHGISAPTPAASKPGEGHALAQQAKHARQLAQQEQWLPALEQWASVNRSAHPELRDEAERGQIQALLALGETWLAEQKLKQRLLFASRSSARQQAVEQLSQLYRSNFDWRSDLQLRCAAFMRLQDNASLRALALSLLENDHAGLALNAALLLPEKERTAEVQALMLRTALQKNWQQLFERLLAELPGNAERELWQGQRHASLGEWQPAATSFAISSKLGASSLAQDLSRHLASGLALQQQIALERSKARANPAFGTPPGTALSPTLSPTLSQAWADWQASHPGPRQWQELPGQILDFAGSHSLYQINQDSYSHSYRAEPARPLKLRVLGPITLRLEARPLHARHSRTMLEGWFKIEETASGQLWPLAINQNWPANGLKLVGNNDQVPGQAVWKELTLGPGWHELALSGEGMPLLINAKTLVPALPLPVLPLLTADSLRNQPRPTLHSLPTSTWACRDCSNIISQPDAAAAPRLLRWQTPVAPLGPGLRASALDALQPTPTDMAIIPAFAASGPADASPSSAPASGFSGAPAGTSTSSTASAPSASALLARQVASQDWPALLQTLQASAAASKTGAALDPESIREQLSALLWRSEHSSSQSQGWLALASSLQAQQPQVSGIGSIMERLLRNSEWMPVASVQSSAGMRSRMIASQEPESPALRVRRALLSNLHPDEYLLGSGSRMVLNWFNTRPGTLKLTLFNRDVSQQPPAPLLAQVQINQGPIQSVTLDIDSATSQNGITLPLALGRGQQNIRVWIKNPLANQFLGARLDEKLAGRSTVPDASERFYQVATAAEPIKLTLPGPVWLRLDHWVDGQTHSRYRLLDQALNKLSLSPRPGEKEALFRIFTRQVVPQRPVAAPRQIAISPIPVPAPLLALPEPFDSRADATPATPSTPAPPRLNTNPATPPLPLGGQERGTVSVFGRLTQAPAPAAAPQQRLSIDSGASYRLYDAVQRNWYRADLFTRKQQGVPQAALGGQASISHDPQWAGLRLGADAALLLHKQPGQARLQMALRGFVKQQRIINPLLQHEPKLTLVLNHQFNPQTSHSSELAAGNDAASPDIASALPGNKQRLGLEWSDQLQYRPQLDTLWSGQFKLTTRPTLLPEA